MPIATTRRKLRGGRRAARGKPNVLSLFCPAFGTADGYGNAAEQMALALERAGIKVTLAGLVMRSGYQNAGHIFEAAPEFGDQIVFFSQPTSWTRQQNGRLAVGFTMYESDVLPAKWYDGMRNVEEIWVPSDWNREVFSAHVPERPVYRVPLGVDSDAFAFEAKQRGERLRFGHFATIGWEPRKGADLAVKAFQRAFEGRKDVELVLRSTKGGQAPVWDERIIVEGGPLTTAALADWYRGLDALIYPSRGEGFGLIPLEAMACGRPVIFAPAGGMAEFKGLGLPVPFRPVEALIGLDPRFFHREGHYFEPDLEGLVERLREVDSDYDVCRAQAGRDAKAVALKFTWDKTAAAMLARLGAN